MRVGAKQLVQDAHPLWPRRPLQTTVAPRKRACFGPHHTVLAPVVGPGTAPSCCSISCTELMFLFRVWLPFVLFLCVVCVRFYFELISVCVRGHLKKSSGCVFFHDESWKLRAKGRGMNWELWSPCVEAPTKTACLIRNTCMCFDVSTKNWGWSQWTTGTDMDWTSWHLSNNETSLQYSKCFRQIWRYGDL